MSIRNGEGGLMLLAGTDGSDRKSPPPPPAPADVARTESATSAVGPRPQAPTLTFSSAPPPPAADEFEERAIDKSPSVHAREETYSEADGGSVPRDDVSVPPVGLDNDFFGTDPAFSADASLEMDPRDPRLLKLTPLMAQRRARFTKYVTVAVGSAAILCAAAVVKITISRGGEGSARAESHVTPMAAPSPVAEQEPVVVVPGENAAGEGTTVRAEPAAAAPVQLVQAEAPAAQAAAPSAVEAPAVPTDVADLDPKALAKEANKAKAKARGALEFGKMGDAIAAGERSVAIDPTDGEAWLILGAAYQQKGDGKNAVRSFKACLDQGKRGPRNECAAMMR